MPMMKQPVAIAFLLFVLLFSACVTAPSTTVPSPAPQPDGSPSFTDTPLVTTVARNLEVPWALVLLPDNGIVSPSEPAESDSSITRADYPTSLYSS